ncbi:hypothetical protein RHGRI_037633 [Rhododendron griersonianum]|uniref:Glutaredoxin domain-containing protein n=1 Tax=Rhododendron griersonianum TaxID=479676 RepID=A0AAV6HT32_9ERIC|nr:hypothetical protein RHGRI_037633 [Rhododendron griersonianum]
MPQAILYRTWPPPSSTPATSWSSAATPTNNAFGRSAKYTGTSVGKLVAENAVVVIGRRGCCMCHVVKRLLLGLGVNPPVVDVDEREEAAVIHELSGIVGYGGLQFPAVFMRGKLFGGLERVMASHISGELVPILKEAGALWL